MRVVTWNVNSIRARVESAAVWLKQMLPDIVLLQETKCVNDDFPHEIFEDLGYNIALHGQKSYNGVAILSKTPLEDVHTTFQCGMNDDQCRFIEGVTQGRRFISLYVPNGSEVDSDKYIHKLKFLNAFYEYVKALLKYNEPLIIGGDFNVAPDLQDGYDPQLFQRQDRIPITLRERQAFFKLLSLGLYDGLKLFKKSQKDLTGMPFTWWDYRINSFIANKGYRIDHLLISPCCADQMISAGVDCTLRDIVKPSDHAPVWINLK